jgi:hypothetical protein
MLKTSRDYLSRMMAASWMDCFALGVSRRTLSVRRFDWLRLLPRFASTIDRYMFPVHHNYVKLRSTW